MISSPQAAHRAARGFRQTGCGGRKRFPALPRAACRSPSARPCSICVAGRIGEEATLVHGDHLVPCPERLRQLGGLRRRQRLVAHGIERHAGRQHQALLRAANGDVDAPFIVAIIGGSQRRDRIDQIERRVLGAIDRLADLGDWREAAGCGLIVQDADRLDLVVLVIAQLGFDRCRVGADPPVGRNDFRNAGRISPPCFSMQGELPGLDDQHAVAGRERIDQGAFPGAGAGGGVDDHRVGGLEDGLDAVEAALGELGEFRPAMVDDRRIHGPQHAVGKWRGAGNMQEMPADRTGGILRHCSSPLCAGRCPPDILWG